MALEIELAYFERHRAQWLSDHPGEFVLIKEEECVGFFDTFDAAYEAGVGKWGVVTFLIKEVLGEDRIEYVPALTLGLIHAGTERTSTR